MGAMRFGTVTDEAASFAILDRYVEAGGNFIDTSNNYLYLVNGTEGGESEALAAAGAVRVLEVKRSRYAAGRSRRHVDGVGGYRVGHLIADVVRSDDGHLRVRCHGNRRDGERDGGLPRGDGDTLRHGQDAPGRLEVHSLRGVGGPGQRDGSGAGLPADDRRRERDRGEARLYRERGRCRGAADAHRHHGVHRRGLVRHVERDSRVGAARGYTDLAREVLDVVWVIRGRRAGQPAGRRGVAEVHEIFVAERRPIERARTGRRDQGDLVAALPRRE
ncbi:MAG: aldo/keto reductase [Trebonia sp.]